MRPLAITPSVKRISLFLFWYRLATLAYVAILGVAGVSISWWVLIAGVLYNALIVNYRDSILERLAGRPQLLLLDLVVVFSFSFSGAPESPYYLYTFAPILLGAFMFGYTGAVLFTSIAFVMFYTSLSFRGYNLQVYIAYGEHLGTYFSFYLIAALGMAYLAELVTKLDKAKDVAEMVTKELCQAKRCLELSLMINLLSLREAQVLALTSRGQSVEEIAGEIGVSPNTVKSYLRRIYEKLKVSSKPELVSMIASKRDE